MKLFSSIKSVFTRSEVVYDRAQEETREYRREDSEEDYESDILVFVYGTLLTNQRNHKIAAPYLKNVRNGSVKGRLYDTGSFPALILDTDGYAVEGEWFTVSPEGLRNMDRLEGYRGPQECNFYDRVQVNDIDQNITGWVYVWGNSKGLPEISTGSWRLNQLNKSISAQNVH